MTNMETETISTSPTGGISATPSGNVGTADYTNSTPSDNGFSQSPVSGDMAAPMPAGISGLSEELKGSKALGNFKDVDSLAKSYLHLNGLLGKKFDELSPSELEGYYSKLGRPEKPEEYSMPDKYNQEAMSWYKNQAFELGLTQQQARNLAEKYAELESNHQREVAINQEAQANQWVSELRQDFGPAFEQRIDVARKAVEEYGGPELKEYLNKTGLGNNPAMVRAFAKIGKELSEGTMAQADSAAKFGHTPQEAAQRISELHRDPNFMRAYTKANVPGHEAAVQEMLKWNEIKHAGMDE